MNPLFIRGYDDIYNFKYPLGNGTMGTRMRKSFPSGMDRDGILNPSHTWDFDIPMEISTKLWSCVVVDTCDGFYFLEIKRAISIPFLNII